LPQHRADLERSGLSEDQITACGFYSLTDPKRVAELLRWRRPAPQLGPCLAIPFHGVDGANGYVRLKPDTPRKGKKDGKPVKYESPLGLPNQLYIPPGTRSALASTDAPLVITEGEKKAAKADQESFPCLGLVGVYGWQKKRAKHKADAPRELIDDLAGIPWEGRTVYLCYDSDLATKPEVRWAEWHLAQALAEMSATVKVIRLPGGSPDAEGTAAKVGLDDYLVAHGASAFHQLLAAAEAARPPEDPRPEILLSPLEHVAVAEAVVALARNDKGLFQRGGQLVRITQPSRSLAARRLRLANGPKIEPIPAADLRTRLTSCARIVALKREGTGLVKQPAHPSPWLVPGIASLGHWPGIRHLEAVVTAPVLLPDGAVLQRPGYHADSGLLYQPAPDVDYSPIPERPTRADAVRALGELLEVVCDFPFAQPEHQGAWLAGLLTPLARFAFDGPAPLFHIDANVRAAGKGLLADTIAHIVFGREFARAAYTTDDDEMRKSILSVALSGEQAVFLDNVAGVLGNPCLDAALTATEWSGRVLGTNQQPRLPLLATWFSTGNNVMLVGDTARRVCHIRLESPDEKPEERAEFRHPNLLAWVREHRGRLLAAALTVLSAYCRAGRPDQGLKPWGSYEGWTALVRNAVAWVGMTDPGLARQELCERSDQEAEALRRLIAGWKEIDPDGAGKTAGQVLELLRDKANASRYALLREVLADLFDLPQGKLPSTPKLGYVLRRFRGRNVGGRCFDSRPAHGGVQAWHVRPVGRSGNSPGSSDRNRCGGDGGDGGDVSPASERREGPDRGVTNRVGRVNIPTITTIPTTTGMEEGEL
jgi:hypothetical protein